ncbi:MAG: hypothetical protein MUF84_06795 [Anaerolineae bacterium]|jgi:hypothetical protein|nr:hypothetical protein [Anaerolineae bacterium]
MNSIVCSVCDNIGHYLEIDNPQTPSDDDESHEFPHAVLALKSPNVDLEGYYRYKSERLLKCPVCGAYYWYQRWAPGGSEDAMRTYIHESLRRLSLPEVRTLLSDTIERAREKARTDGGFYIGDYELVRLGADAELAGIRILECQCGRS